MVDRAAVLIEARSLRDNPERGVVVYGEKIEDCLRRLGECGQNGDVRGLRKSLCIRLGKVNTVLERLARRPVME